MTSIPNGWAETRIGQICELFNGRAFKPSDWGTEGLPIIRIQNLNNPSAKFNCFSGVVEAKFIVDHNDLLFAWSGTPGTSFGAHIWTGGKSVLNQHIFNVKFNAGCIDRVFFKHAINLTLDEQIEKAHGGVGLRHVTKGKFEGTVIQLPPLAEQRRIVAKIESLSAKSIRARDHLGHLQRLVEKYKQALLENAFRGKLTNHNLAHFSECPLGEIIEEGPTNGWSPLSGADARGALSLKLTATTSGSLRLDSKAVKRIYEMPPSDSSFWLVPGDILVQRANALEHLGATAIYDGPSRTYIYPDLMMRIRVSNEMDRRYLWRFLNSHRARSFFRANATGTAGNMPKISGSTLRRLSIPFPSPEIRAEVVTRVDTAFAWIDRLAAEATSAHKLVDRLDQAILSKAFRGALVPQDPSDEPASVLLKRIKADKAGSAPPRRGRGRPRAVPA